ncbi:MAG: hypothetical protein HYX40_09030 [Sphingobacteriales bacterium]|nr:hypothetical protein [Sphingobacteriales bacterium]
MHNICSKRFFSIIPLLVLSISNLKGQDSLRVVQKPVFVHTDFFYDFPQSFGASAGVDFVIGTKLKITKTKNASEKVSHRDLIVSADIGFYRYPFNHSGLYFSPAIGKRYYDVKPYYFELLLNAGMLRTFYDGSVYTVDNTGNVKELKKYGRYYFTTGFAGVFGHDFERSKKPKPFALQVKPFFWIQYPYNSYLLPHLSLEVGFKYHLKKFNLPVKQKILSTFYSK